MHSLKKLHDKEKYCETIQENRKNQQKLNKKYDLENTPNMLKTDIIQRQESRKSGQIKC